MPLLLKKEFQFLLGRLETGEENGAMIYVYKFQSLR